ncbi:MAG: RluA family pseudouridine synthase [Firmicutes bacterium]|nr:RluA family pseudouridine synthase [Bacillota bacterium]
MPLLRYTVNQEDEGLRIDIFLARTSELPSRTFVQKLLKNGRVTVNAQTVKPSYLLQKGDLVTVDFEEPKPPTVEAEDIPLDILYEDQDLVVVNKPRGMVVHPAPGNQRGTLVNALLNYCKDLSGIGGVIRPGIVHRLDKDTSGVLVVAKHDQSHLSLARQLKQRTMVRLYLALVHGRPSAVEGTISAPIGRHPVHRKRMAVSAEGRPATTYYRILEELGPYTLLQVQLSTGRTHQIRVHLQYLGHPVAGDQVYGRRTEPFTIEGQALHAATLRLLHPRTGQLMEFTAPLPSDFQRVLAYCRKKWEKK